MKEIALTQNKVALVDDSDVDFLMQWKWYASATGYKKVQKVKLYAKAWKDRKSLYMHRVILGAQKGQEVDHIDGNSLNNQRHNLRLCVHAQNGLNRGKNSNSPNRYISVFRVQDASTFYFKIRKQGKIYRGSGFYSDKEAAIARDRKAVELFGEFAHLNFPELVCRP